MFRRSLWLAALPVLLGVVSCGSSPQQPTQVTAQAPPAAPVAIVTPGPPPPVQTESLPPPPRGASASTRVNGS